MGLRFSLHQQQFECGQSRKVQNIKTQGLPGPSRKPGANRRTENRPPKGQDLNFKDMWRLLPGTTFQLAHQGLQLSNQLLPPPGLKGNRGNMKPEISLPSRPEAWWCPLPTHRRQGLAAAPPSATNNHGRFLYRGSQERIFCNGRPIGE